MTTTEQTPLDTIMDALFTPYKNRVADVDRIVSAMIQNKLIANEDSIVNDHIAFRTLGVPNLGIASFEKIFLHYGYKRMAPYHFPEKKLNAYWYAPPVERLPRIFISELRVQDLSTQAQDIIKKYTDQVLVDPVDELDLANLEAVGKFFHKPLWSLPSLQDYNLLLEESEYAAWVIYNRYYLNHYTISVHELPGDYSSLENFNVFLESIGVVLNSAGGKVKVSQDGLLKQSSSVAQMVQAEFAKGEKTNIAGSYVEFAERLTLPEFHNIPKEQLSRKHRRDGFEAANADKIFESTYTEQTQKN
ncbi:DUF1338 domain-containing protein [Flagellimonas myxillae]|uniref:DUF1338 domain-containing protein n=1 Tax=Flagellimonas myxillae TaxID=2942214 RepID=UPI00201F2BEF|nr:DUF1338 domain-containing protein [Muricauda myxillae]MCL6265827.1 DUF1338 domain-containing protein [Muricauda myxillae]